MNSITEQSHPQSAAAELDLLPFISALIDARWWILAAAFASAVTTAFWAYSSPYRYESTARVSVIDIEDPGGVSPDDRRASEVLTLVEHGFVMGTTHDNYNDVIRARLGSRKFTQAFLDSQNLYRYFYPKEWDTAQNQWRGGFKPDRGWVFTQFRDLVREIELDEETQIISISMRWPDARLARDWANAYVAEFNEFMRQRTMTDVAAKQAYLRAELEKASVLDMQQSIYRLIEAQTAIAMLASARDEYALEIVDPAALPYRSFNLSRKRKVIIGSIAGALLATFGVLASVLLRDMWRTINDYRNLQKTGSAPGED